MKFITLTCVECDVVFFRELKEYRRSQKLNRPSFCSRRCSGSQNWQHLQENRVYHPNMGRKCDEYSPFRRFLKTAKQRGHECTITLDYLKELWDIQNGICPITHYQMTLVNTNYGYDKTNNPWKPSLDRIDSTKGYIIGNVRFITHIANQCKHSWSDETVKEFARKVVGEL